MDSTLVYIFNGIAQNAQIIVQAIITLCGLAILLTHVIWQKGK